MNNCFIYLLTILLASEFVYCQIVCSEDQSQHQGKCQTCEKIKQYLHDCQANCQKNPLENDQIPIPEEKEQQCKIKCETEKRQYQVNCEQKQCSLIDKRTVPDECLQNYSDCKEGVVSSDGKFCLNKCLNNQIKAKKKDFFKCQDCSTDRTFAIIENKKVCRKRCKDSQVYYLTSKKCINESSCTGFLTNDKLNCVNSCYQSQKMNQNGKIQQCLNKCSTLEYNLENKSYCADACPEGYITDKSNKKCLKDASECQKAVSANGKHCVNSCNKSESETIVLKNITLLSNGTALRQYNQCERCDGFFYPGDDIDQSTCKTSYDVNQITIKPSSRFTKNITDCQNFIMLIDNQSCSTECMGTQLIKGNNCIEEEDCSGENEIIDRTSDQPKCKDKTAEGYSCPFQSADGRTCVKSCFSIGQVEGLGSKPADFNSQNKCEECKYPKKFVLTQQNDQDIGACAQPDQINANQENKEKNKNIENTETPQLEVMLTNLTSIINSTGTSAIRALIDPFIDFFATLQKEEQLESVRYDVHKVGNKSNILVFLQIVQEGKRLKRSLNIDNMMNEIPLDLTEQDSSQIKFQNSSGIVFTIINQNLICANDEACSDFPVVFATIIDLITKKRQSDEDYNLVTVFTSEQESSEYVCLNYDDTLTKITKQSSPKRIEINLECPLIGITSGNLVEQQNELDENGPHFSSSSNESLIVGKIITILMFLTVFVIFA